MSQIKHKSLKSIFNKIAFIILFLFTQSVKAGWWTNGNYIHMVPFSPNSNSNNQYSVGTIVNSAGSS